MTTTTTTTTATRELDGVELPAPGRWAIDPGHADIGFSGRHFMLTTIRGRFTRFSSTVEVGQDPADSTIDVTIEMDSVDTGDATRDDHLRSSDLFVVEQFPTARFRSTDVQWQGPAGTLTGDLTIKDVTRPVTLDVEFLGALTDPWDNDRAIFEAHGTIQRGDWGVSWNMPLANGGVLVSKEIQLHLHVELVRSTS